MKFVIFHGSFGTPDGNWFPQLKESLHNLKQGVLVPEFPVEDWEEFTKKGPETVPRKQNLKNWLKTFEKTEKSIEKNEKLCFIGHSLGPLFILHVVSKYNLKLDSAIFVSPFLKIPNKIWQIDAVNKSFYKKEFNFKKLRKFIPVSYVLYSEDDPYLDKKYMIEFAKKMGSSLIQVRKAGHLNAEVNLREFPLVLELCKSRIELPLYQKYLAHRRELFAVPYIKGKTDEVVYLKSKHDIIDEGTFHFRNLQKSGFCTLYTAGASLWNPESVYMQEARKAAKRIKNLTRVLTVSKIADLKKSGLRKQVKLDIEEGIKVYACIWDNIKKYVPEPDFGVWDNDYLCTVHYDKNNRIKEASLDSRKTSIKKANEWKSIILKKATRIYNMKDIQKFVSKNQSD